MNHRVHAQNKESRPRMEPVSKRPQEAGTRPQEAGRRPQEAGTRPQEAGTRPQEADRRPQEAGRRPQEAGRRPQEAGRRPQEAGRRPPEAGRRPQEAGRRPLDADRRPQEAGRRPQDAGRRPQEVGKRAQEAGEPALSSPEPPATSWARVASLLPRETITWKMSDAGSVASPQGDEPTSALETVSKKKRKKKKAKKANADAEEVEISDVPTPDQEPPQIQDEGEFPDLALASVGPLRGTGNPTNLFSYSSMAKRHKENTNESTPQRDASELCPNKRKDLTTAQKSPPIPLITVETKKGQKAEKGGGQKSEKGGGQKPEKGGGKKSQAPVQLDLGSMLAFLEQKQQSQKSRHDAKPVVLSVGGPLSVVQKDPSAQKKHPKEQLKIAHNPLDSTSPLVKKGKQREVPKAKKPTPLKRIILKEREERKQNRLLEERGVVPTAEEPRPSSDPTEEPEETAVPEEDLIDLTGADGSMLGSPHPQPNDAARTDGRDAEQTDGRDAEQMDGRDAEQTDGRDAAQTDGRDAARTEALDAEQERGSEEIVEEDSAPLKARPPCRPKIHSRKFRDYCSQMLSKEVDECVSVMLKELVRFQDRLYQKDPMKARMKRRLVMGLREVLKHLKLGKVKCVIISPNCERIESKGGLDDALHTIIETCREQNVPFVFALSRKALGRCVNKAVPVSLVGIFNYDGAQDHYHNMIELSSRARKAYEVMIANVENSEQEQELPVEEHAPNSPVTPAETEEPEYMKIWRKMLEKDCNHQLLDFEKQLATVCVAIDSGLQLDEEEGS